MAVHKEHTLRSFPCFPEMENFEDDDDDDDCDNNFVISLEDNGDEVEEYSPLTPVCTSAPYISNSTNENGGISIVPFQTGAESISKVSVSSSASDVYCRDTLIYSQSQVTHLRSNIPPGLYSSSNESRQCNQRSRNDSLLSYPSHYPRSNLDTGIHDQKLAVTTTSTGIKGTAAVSQFTADATDSPQLISGNLPAHFMHLDNHHHEPQSMKSNVSQHNLSTSCSKLPKMHLETIHLDKEVGGIWSEAIFLNTTEVSDSSFPDFGASATLNNGTHFPVPNSSIVPKLSGPYLKTGSPQIITDCSPNVHTGSTVSSLPERVLKMHVLNENTSCSCVMCYKGNVNCEGFQKSQNEDPHLTKNEQLSISKKSGKRKKLMHSGKDIEKKKAQNVNFEMTCPAVSVNNALKTQSVLCYVSKPVASALHTSSQISMLDGLNTSEATQSDSLPAPGVTASKIIVLDMGKKYLPANRLSAYNKMATDGATTSLLQCEPSTIVTGATNVSTAFAVPHMISVPRLSSYPTKVFLKPSEVPGQKSQAVSSALELNSGNTLNLPINGQTSPAQIKVICKETPSANISPSASLTSPCSKVIYVSSDQMFLYPQQTRTPVSIVSVNKQPQVRASNASHITVIQRPSDNIPNKQLPTDSAFKTCHQNVLNKNSNLYQNKQDNLNSTVNAVDASKTLQHVLNGAEKVDNGGHRNVIFKVKQPFSNIVIHNGHMHTSQVTTTAACGTNVSAVYAGSVRMTSLLKDSPQARGGLLSAPICFSDSHSVNTKPRYLPPKIQPSAGLRMPQTLMRLLTPVAQEKLAENSDNTMVNVFRAQSCTTNSSVNNAQNSGNDVPKTFSNTLILKPIATLTYKSPPERDKSVHTRMLSSLKKVSDPHLPQEGLPSTYIEDWVNKTTTYVSEQLRDTDRIQEPHFILPSSGGDSEALLPSSQDAPKESVPLNSAKHGNVNYTISEMAGGIETALSKQEDKSQLQVKSPTHMDFHKPNTLQVLQSESTCTLVSESSSVNIASIDSISMQEELDQSSTINRTGEKLPMSSAVHNRSQEIVSAVHNISHSETGQRTCVKSGDTPALQLYKSLQSSPQSSSSILDSSKGIKLKINLGVLRNEKMKRKQSTDTAEASVKIVENVPVSEITGGLYLKECVNINADKSGCGSDKQIHNTDNSDRTETTEEMFQRCQKQAVQEVVKARMGMGYVSRSLRPTRTTMAFLDKYPYSFGPGKPKKKGLSDKNVCIVSEKSEDSNNCTSKINHVTETSGMNKQHTKKLQVRHKRQVEEAVDKEVKSKHPKVSIKDYPRLKQDCSITDGKTVYCTNILAGHKVYVKFNTFENMCSERAFLVPFFNIGGSRTQFDVEDMEYINKAVMEFESEERSCARHLLYYSRAGNKAVFLRKETNLQASHITDESYRKCSFVLEGFRRSTKKQTESSPEQWKVDNAIDIEIDRAEIDNDIETEFDTNLSLDEVADGLRISAESAEARIPLPISKHPNCKGAETTGLSISANVQGSLQSQDGHLASIKIDAYFSRVNELDLVNIETDLCGVQTESNSVSELREVVATVPVASELSDSVVNLDQRLSYADKFQGSLSDLQRESANRDVQQILHPNICAAVKEEVLIDESDASYPFGRTFNSAWIKKEKLNDDDVDDESIQQLESSHPACNISSVNSSPRGGRCGEQILDEDIFIKNEPVDDYFDPLEETEPCPSGNNQMKVTQQITNLSCSRLANLSKIPVHRLKPADQAVTVTSKEVIISNTLADAAHVKTSTIYSQLNDSHELQDHITGASSTASHTQISSLQPGGDIVPIHIHVGDCRMNSLFPPLTNIDADKSACDIDDSASVKLTSITEPSLPESPLPSSSMSYSSEILASSDIDDKFISSESDFSAISQSSMLITEVTSEDEDKAANQNIVQNKITSLVESLRHRLTQDTSNLPPWIASVNKSATDTKVKKRKIMKLKKKRSQCNTASAHVPGDISISATEICSASQTSALSSPVLSSVSYSVHQPTSLLHSPPTTSVLATPSLQLDALPSTETSNISAVNLPPTLGPKGNSNNNPILPLPEKTAHLSFIKQASTSNICNTSKRDYVVVAEYASNYMADEKVISEAEDIIDIDVDSLHGKCEAKTVALSDLATDTSWSDFVCTRNNKLSNDNFHSGLMDNNFTACSETLNQNRQSPVDFEIEIGKEDLPETALSLQLILPNEDLDIEALKLSRRKHIREFDPDISVVSSPETVTTFQKCDVGMKLHSVNNLRKDTSSLSKLEKRKTKHSKENNSLMNTQFGITDYHTNQLQASVESETRQEGSVTSYLCNKFSFQEKNHIKGPRLLHMPSNRRPSITEAGKQKAPMQGILNTLAQAEPITTEELLKTPSLDEIFGASVRKEFMADAENKVDSVAKCASQMSVNSNSRTKQRMMHFNTSKVPISRKNKQNKKKGDNSRLVSDISHSMAAAFQPKIVLSAIKPPIPNPISHSVNQTESGSEGISNMNVCKVVLTKLELSNLDKLSENVFLIRNETAVKEKQHIKVTSTDADSVSRVNNSKSTFKRAVKNKRRKIARPGFRRKGDVIDYYAYMLETLQKKAQQLEEETRKKEAQELAMKVHLESTRCGEMKELEQATDASERDDIAAKFDAMNSQGTNNKEMEEVKDSAKEMCSLKVEVDCLSQPSDEIASSLEDPINAVSTNSKDEPTFTSVLECGIPSEKTADSDAIDHVSLTDTAVASKKGHEPCVLSEVVDASDSDWPYLQKLCDETIFSQGNTDYLQKTNKDICFPSTNEGSNCEVKFEKKDIVLCSSVNDRAVLGEINSCEIFDNTEDKSGCIEQCTDEQEIDNVDEDEILLGLKIKMSSEFSCDDQETRTLSFPQSPADMHMGSLDDGNILDTSCKSGGISLHENISSAVTIDRENAQSVPISCQLESTDPVADTLNSTSNSCSTAASQLLSEQSVTVKNEKSQRTVDISPSWERLLGHNSVNISSQFSGDTSTSHPETLQNHDVSLVASCNFKLKFKLPKGILSKARQLSRDIKHVLEQPASDGTLLSNSEVPPHTSLDETFKNNTSTHDNCRELTENKDCSDYVKAQPSENQKAQQMSVSKLKFSSVTWNAIQKAKAEFLQKRTNEKRFNEGSTFEHQQSENITNTLDGEQAHGVDLLSAHGKENTSAQHQGNSDDKELMSDNACCISGQESNQLSASFLDGIICDLSLNEGSRLAPIKELPSNNANVECKESEMKVTVQADSVIVSESSVGDSTADPSMCLKQRKDGIFSNLDLFQGCDADAPKQTNEQSSELPKDAEQQSSNKEVLTDNISKVNVIDIEKLKLKLNPVLLGKIKENTENNVTTLHHSAPISSALIEQFAKTSFRKLQQKLNPHTLAKQTAAELNIHTSQESEGDTSVAKTILQCSSVGSVALLDSHERSSESDPSNVTLNGQVSDKLDTNMTQSRPANSSSEMSDLFVSTCRQFSQVNTAKLCTILKNFHKAGSTSNSVSTNPERTLVDSSAGNIVSNQDNAGTGRPKLQCSLRKSKQLRSAANIATAESDARRRTRGKRKKCPSVSEKHEPMANTSMTMAKRIRQKISTASCVSGIPPKQLGEGHDGTVCKNEPLDSEDKGERSFFDCLSSVPLDAWE